MNIRLTDREQNQLNSLIHLHLGFENLREYLEAFRMLTASLLESEYNGILLFKNRLFQQHFSVDNNPIGFNRLYFERLMKKDKALRNLFEYPGRVFSFQRDYRDDREITNMIQEMSRERPTGDYFYEPLIYEGEVIGFMGQIKTEGPDISFDDTSFFLSRMAKNNLYNGLLHFIQKDKINLLMQRESTKEGAFFFLGLNNRMSITDPVSAEFLERLFPGQKNRSALPDCHPLLENIIREMTKPGRPENRSLGVWIQGLPYRVQCCRSLNRTDYPLQLLFTIVPDGELHSYQQMRLAFSLTKREMDIIRLTMKAFSNREIGEKLFISEATVKKHLSNIFEKTRVSSRTELVLLANRF